MRYDVYSPSAYEPKLGPTRHPLPRTTRQRRQYALREHHNLRSLDADQKAEVLGFSDPLHVFHTTPPLFGSQLQNIDVSQLLAASKQSRRFRSLFAAVSTFGETFKLLG